MLDLARRFHTLCHSLLTKAHSLNLALSLSPKPRAILSDNSRQLLADWPEQTESQQLSPPASLNLGPTETAG